MWYRMSYRIGARGVHRCCCCSWPTRVKQADWLPVQMLLYRRPWSVCVPSPFKEYVMKHLGVPRALSCRGWCCSSRRSVLCLAHATSSYWPMAVVVCTKLHFHWKVSSDGHWRVRCPRSVWIAASWSPCSSDTCFNVVLHLSSSSSPSLTSACFSFV